MRIAERFDRHAATLVRITALKAQLKALEGEAEPDHDFILEWFRARPNKRRYRGIQYSKSPFKHFDQKGAKAALGAVKTAQLTETRYRESLSRDEQAKSVRTTEAQLKPLKRASA